MADLAPWSTSRGGSAPPRVGATLAELGDGASDGAPGLLILGDELHELTWISADERWQGTREHVLIDQRDTWGMDLSNYARAAIANSYRRLYCALPYGKARAALTAQANAGAATLDTTDTSAFAAAGTLRIRGDNVTYTGKTANTFTGCAGLTVTQPASATLITQGEVGGWGLSVVPFDGAGELYAAGFELEARMTAFLVGSFDHCAMTLGAYCWQMDEGESFARPGLEATGGLGMAATLTGPTDDGTADRLAERDFRQRVGAWAALPFTPTKRFLLPGLFARMDHADPQDNGEEYACQLRVRVRSVAA